MLEPDTLKALAATEGLCVSLYSPMHRAGKDTRENPIRFKNLLQEARRRLEAAEFGPPEIGELLAEVEAQLDDYDFWQHQQDGLATFIAPGRTEQHRLAAPVPELCTIGRHFYLAPLVPLLTEQMRFFVLELNLGGARLFEGSREDLRELVLEAVPVSLEEATRFDVYQPSEEKRNVTPPGGEGPVFGRGHGEADTKKEDVRFFFEHLENGVTKVLADSQAPLVLAGVDYLQALYREVNHYPCLAGTAISGSPEGWQDEELHRRAWALLEPRFAREKEEAVARYGTAQAEGKGSDELVEILPAALDGRVDILLLRPGAHAWGTFDTEARAVSREEADDVDNDDLLDLAASHTLLGGGRVYLVETLSDGVDAAAIYRY